ncbi:hypothetical protein ENBRE01_2121 [Enteropsectra breve]|nr:hypothetical protein ENBRE01_2121 [Enteropsectra breve]
MISFRFYQVGLIRAASLFQGGIANNANANDVKDLNVAERLGNIVLSPHALEVKNAYSGGPNSSSQAETSTKRSEEAFIYCTICQDRLEFPLNHSEPHEILNIPEQLSLSCKKCKRTIGNEELCSLVYLKMATCQNFLIFEEIIKTTNIFKNFTEFLKFLICGNQLANGESISNISKLLLQAEVISKAEMKDLNSLFSHKEMEMPKDLIQEIEKFCAKSNKSKSVTRNFREDSESSDKYILERSIIFISILRNYICKPSDEKYEKIISCIASVENSELKLLLGRILIKHIFKTNVSIEYCLKIHRLYTEHKIMDKTKLCYAIGSVLERMDDARLSDAFPFLLESSLWESAAYVFPQKMANIVFKILEYLAQSEKEALCRRTCDNLLDVFKNTEGLCKAMLFDIASFIFSENFSYPKVHFLSILKERVAQTGLDLKDVMRLDPLNVNDKFSDIQIKKICMVQCPKVSLCILILFILKDQLSPKFITELCIYLYDLREECLLRYLLKVQYSNLILENLEILKGEYEKLRRIDVFDALKTSKYSGSRIPSGLSN